MSRRAKRDSSPDHPASSHPARRCVRRGSRSCHGHGLLRGCDRGFHHHRGSGPRYAPRRGRDQGLRYPGSSRGFRPRRVRPAKCRDARRQSVVGQNRFGNCDRASTLRGFRPVHDEPCFSPHSGSASHFDDAIPQKRTFPRALRSPQSLPNASATACFYSLYPPGQFEQLTLLSQTVNQESARAAMPHYFSMEASRRNHEGRNARTHAA